MQKRKKILLTIDVEDWFQVENLRPWFPPDRWNQQIQRVEQNTQRLLDLFDSTSPGNRPSPKVTFFILGWVADRIPYLVREIHQRGHEVASHGYSHQMCNQISIEALENDLVNSKKLLEDIIGSRIEGYRAPNFSINDQALNVIKGAGYVYDSSYNNFSKHGRYGNLSIDGTTKQDICIRFPNNFYELPISNLQIANQIIPWGGGGYFRFLPFPLFKTGIKHILKKQDAYMFYLHPWEIDPKQPRVKQAKGLSGWRHYLNLNKTYDRLQQLITSFRTCDFITCRKYIENINNSRTDTK